MNIRPMTDADIQAVVELDHLSFSQPWPDGAFVQELVNNDSRCRVAEVDGRIAGVLVFWRVLDEAHLATIATHPDFRRQGVARQLLQACMDEVYEEGARIYHLEVRAGNLAAIRMYEQFGYEVVGRRPKYYKNNGEDALLMTLLR